MANLIDTVVGYLSPSAGLRRAQARAAMTHVRAYEAARSRRSNDNWITPSTAANVEVGESIVTTRNRARQLVRDNPMAGRIVSVWSAHVVGDGIIAQANTGNDRLDEILQAEYDAWAESTDCDADGQSDLAGLLDLAFTAEVESGESIIRIRHRKPSDYPWLRVPMQLQVLEGDYLDHTKNARLDNGGCIIQGVEFDKRGRRVAYWLHTEHPGDYYAGRSTLQSIRIPADEVIHLYTKKRPGQVRGITWLHSAVLKLRDLDDYHDALLMKAKIEACFSGFVTYRDDDGGTPAMAPRRSDGGGHVIEEFEPGLIHYLREGESITFADPSNSDAHTLLSRTLTMSIAVGSGLTYDQVSGDLTGANYGSLRAGKIEFRRLVSKIQWRHLIPIACDPIWRAFVKKGASAGLWREGPHRAEWTPPQHEPIDPKKDGDAERADIDYGLATWSQTVRGRGYNPRRQMRELAKERAELAKLGISIGSPHGTQVGGQPTEDPDKETKDE